MMNNPMNIMQTLQQFNQFKDMLQKSGKDPAVLLDQMVKSGQVTQQQLEQAKQMAEMAKSLLGGKL